MSDPITITIFTVGIGLSVPILLAALGELVAEQAGVINVGIEGVMLIGAIAAAIMFHFNDSFLLATLVGVATGLLCGVVLGWMYVFRGMNQIVTGFVFNIFALGLTTSLFASEEYLAGDLNDTLPDISVPALESIPWLGEVLFQQDAMVYAAIVATVAIWLLMSRTWFGVYVRAAGERPSAVLATGRDVQWVRFNAMLIACGFAGFAGAALIVAVAGAFNVNITVGQGFIALAVVVVARWRPVFVALVALGFGVTQGLQFQVNDLGFLSGLPTEFWIALPYMVVILALALSRGSQYPPALGIPYIKPGARSLLQRVRDRLAGGSSDDALSTEAPPPSGTTAGSGATEMRAQRDSRSHGDPKEPR